MRQALSLALALAILGLSPGSTARANANANANASTEVLEQAKKLLAARDYSRAVAVLEDALPEAGPGDRHALIDLLRDGYRNLIRQAEAAGKKSDADAYRDNLDILDKSSPPGKAPAQPPPAQAQTETPAAPTVPAPAPERQRVPRSERPADPSLGEPSPLPDPGPLPSLEGPAPGMIKAGAISTAPSGSKPAAEAPVHAPANTARPIAPLPAPSEERPSVPRTSEAAPAEPGSAREQAGPPRPPAQGADPELMRADLLFTGKKYEAAGQIYARLAAQNRLPAQRKQVWAYCRWVAVVARINAQPRDDQQWDEIEKEVRSIQRLTPGNWYGEYLQSRVAEARKASHPAGRSGRLVVRGSEPDESPPRGFPRLLNRFRSAPAAAAEDRPATPAPEVSGPRDSASANADAPSASSAPDEGPTTDAADRTARDAPQTPFRWSLRETANFRVFHTDPALAEKAAQAAESVRSRQSRRWGSSAHKANWSPRCDIYLYPTPGDFARMTGQPEVSPGFSTMGINANKIIARRVNLRADHPQLLSAILPHEVTHVVLADLFTQQQIPRWADEGMAVLAEPLSEQLSRASELFGPLKEGRVFKLSELMATDYPSHESWNLYYAQSVSLTQFLVEQGTPEQFIAFVRGAQRAGVESTLQEVYHIAGFAELEKRWSEFARRQAAEVTASSRDAAGSADSTLRR